MDHGDGTIVPIEASSVAAMLQSHLNEGDVGISPVLLQAVNQTLDSNTRTLAPDTGQYSVLSASNPNQTIAVNYLLPGTVCTDQKL